MKVGIEGRKFEIGFTAGRRREKAVAVGQGFGVETSDDLARVAPAVAGIAYRFLARGKKFQTPVEGVRYPRVNVARI
jgi:hypothetical protein